MDLKSALTRIISFFKKVRKDNLLMGSLLFISAIISLLPGVINLIDGLSGFSLTIITVNDYLSIIMNSVLLMLPSLVLFCVAYLIWEGHSLGWKLSRSTLGITILLAITCPGIKLSFMGAQMLFIDFTLPIALLSGFAVLFLSMQRRSGHQTKDSPIAMENVVKLGLRLSAFTCIAVVISMLIYIVVMASPFLSIGFFTSTKLSITNVERVAQQLPPNGPVGGVLSYALGSLLLVIFCELIAVPIGICAAIYLAEYSTQGKVVSAIRFFIEVLSRIAFYCRRSDRIYHIFCTAKLGL